MSQVRMLVAAALLISLAENRSAAGHPGQPGQIIELRGDLAAEMADTQAPMLDLADLYSCNYAGETPGPSLLGTVRAGALILTRSHATAQPSSKVFRVADDALLLDTADLELGTSAGFDLTLLAALGQYNELEIRYFDIDDWSTSRSFGDPTGVRFEGFGLSTSALSQRMDYASQLASFELSLRPRVAEGIPLVLGFRTLQLHERFELWQLDPQPESAILGTSTHNYLYGFQAGMEPYFFGGDGPLRLEGLLKAGIYGNHVSQGTLATVSQTAAGGRRDRASFVGEVGLMLDYRFSRFFAARAGYELLWLYGVALAPDQGATSDLLSPGSSLQSSATAFYHGATVSLEFVF